MDEIKKDIQVIRESQIRMEADVRHHIARTDALEEKVTKHEELMMPLVVFNWFKANHRFIIFLIGLIASITYLMVKKL